MLSNLALFLPAAVPRVVVLDAESPEDEDGLGLVAVSS